MDEASLLLSRIQFGFTIGYHIIFPTLSIGLAWFLLIMRGLEYRTGKPQYRQAFDFWQKIFALTFGMGVVSGVVLSYQIGTNWGRFSEIAGPVVGPLMSFEVLSAFFLEAGFLGIMLLGRQRTGPALHLFATAMVAIGTFLSAFWVISANSFMHTPAGYVVENGIVIPSNWSEAIFNPSFPYRLSHMLTASLLTTSFVVISAGAMYVIKGEHREFGKSALRWGIAAACILAPLQIAVGDAHGLNTLEHQPAKVAAMEGHWNTSGNVPLLLFAIPDQEAAENHFEIAIPNLASLILTHSADGVIQGLTDWPAEDRPPVATVFFSFRAMVGIGMLMLLLSWLSLFKLLRGSLFESNKLLWALRLMWPSGFVAVICGWVTTEVGRQPWVVHGLLRTRDASSLVPSSNVAFTLAMFVVVYCLFLVIYFYFVNKVIQTGPPSIEEVIASQSNDNSVQQGAKS
jgi:cytochrome d ubiquinol oxidase subunit I